MPERDKIVTVHVVVDTAVALETTRSLGPIFQGLVNSRTSNVYLDMIEQLSGQIRETTGSEAMA